MNSFNPVEMAQMREQEIAEALKKNLACLGAFGRMIVFGAATVVFGLSEWMWLSVISLAILGAADTVSVVIRFSLVQLATPDEMRGRVGAVNFLFINASNQLGQFESGVTAALFGDRKSVV
mgnify:CR=1 FL=1